MRSAATAAITIIIAATNTFAEASAHAADPQPSADALFKEGNALAVAGHYAEACPKLAESQRIEPAVGTQFNLADCYEHLGKTATAYANFSDVAHIARAAGKFERERLAKERAIALESKLAHLHVVVKSPAPGLEIKIDDAILPRDQWISASPSAAPPIDAGTHHIVASAPSRTTWEASFDATDGSIAEALVPELIDPNPKSVAPPPAIPEKPPSSQRTIAIAVGGIAVAGLITGAVGGILSISKRSSAKDTCPEATYHFHCPTQQGTDDWNGATTTGNVSTIGFIIGGVALTGAAVLWFTTPSSKVRAGVAANGLRLEGSF
jgi:hypothetical protein